MSLRLLAALTLTIVLAGCVTTGNNDDAALETTA
jgi:hypothetical protein